MLIYWGVVNQFPMDVGTFPCRVFEILGHLFHIGKIWTCNRVFGRDAQDISLWGLMCGDHIKNSRTHYFCQ